MNRLHGLFCPKNIAIIGASERNHYSASLIQNLLRFGFPAEAIYPINPKYQTVFDRPCYPHVSDIPDKLDLAVFAVSRDHLLPLLNESITKGLKSALILSTGFAESDEIGRKLQNEIAALAKQHSVNLCGPNTLGYVSNQGGVALWSSPLPSHMRPGPVGALFHSSGLLNLFLNVAADRCLGFRYAIACGNEADLGMVDYMEALLDDPEVKVIVTLIESIRQPAEFCALLDRAGEIDKPVVALRVGRSAKGSRAVVSHTGNLATSGAAWQAVFRQKGIISVDNMDQMVETTIGLANNPCQRRRIKRPAGVGIVTISGGDCSFLSDISERINLQLPEPSDRTYRALSPYFGKKSFNGNPLDIEDLHQVDEDKFYSCLKAFASEEAFDLVCCRLSLPKAPNEGLKRLYTRSAAISKQQGKGMVFLSRASEHLDPSWFEFFSQLKVPFLMEYEKGMRAVRDLLWLASLPDTPSIASRGDTPSRKVDINPLKSLLSANPNKHLTHDQSRQLLAAYHIPLANEALARSARDAVEAAKQIGFPVAMKVISSDLPHKTELGALLIDIADERAVEEGFNLLQQRAQRKVPHAVVEGILIQKMVRGIAETIVGTNHDPQLGPVVLFGLGGIYTEIFKDFSLRMPPLTSYDATEMIGDVKGSDLLRGARGRSKADIEGIVDVILKVSQLAMDFRGELDSIELNPVIALSEGQGVLVVDTLLTLKNQK